MLRSYNVPGKLLSVPHRKQIAEGYCLPACVQMVWAYLGLSATQERLSRLLLLDPRMGVPLSNVQRLQNSQLLVSTSSGMLEDIAQHLENNCPVIVYVQAGELPYWREHVSQHAVVVIGLEIARVSILDPALETGPTVVPMGDFMLAWSEMDYFYTVFKKGQSAIA